MQLRDWQNRVQFTIMEKNPMLPRLSAVEVDLLAAIKNQGVDVATRVSIYTNAYVLRLTEALSSNFPMIHKVLGDESFAEMAALYLQTYPPSHTSIRWYGEYLSLFLAEHKPWCDLPILIELATFEWAFRHSIDAADVECVTVELMQSLTPEQWADMTFHIHPSLTVLPLCWNVPQVWQALNDNEEPPSPAENPLTWIVYRQKDMSSAWRSIDALEALALASVQQGKTFADLCELIAQTFDDSSDVAEKVPPLAAGFLRTWVEQGLLTR